MSTDKQRVANQINAQRSTGPRTAEGKAIVARNSITHGLRSTTGRERSKSRRAHQAFLDFADALKRELSPVGLLQLIVFNQIMTLGWKLLRLKRVERAILRADRRERLEEQRREENKYGEIAIPLETGALTDAHLIARWFRASIGDGRNAHATIRRYEAGIERSFYRACAELKKLQAESRETGAPLEGTVLAEQSQFSGEAFNSNDRPGQQLEDAT